MKTLYDKIWDAHLVLTKDDGTSILYIDRHLVHEVTSPQAFEGLELANRSIFRKESILAVCDHNVPTQGRIKGIDDPESKLQVETLRENAKKWGLSYFDLLDKQQGIVHIVGPEQGFTLPGTTIVCGDSHTSTHGAFGALAFGIGTSEIEHVLATQTLVMKKSKNMLVKTNGKTPKGVDAKDIILAIIAKIGTAGGTGHVIEYQGEAITDLSMEGRMTLCNMSIEAGARAGLVAPDKKTNAYLKDLPLAPKGIFFDQALAYFETLYSDDGAHFDKVVEIDVSNLSPFVTWGTNPEMALPIEGNIPDPEVQTDQTLKATYARALDYMGLEKNKPLTSIPVDQVFIGSCTNARIEDLRAAASIVEGKKVSSKVKRAMVVPGSGLVKEAAEKEGLDKIFIEAGFQWREPGCSMCLAMNADRLEPGEHCASTSNRNFEGRQGRGGRTHLMSPIMAAAAALHGHIVDVRNYLKD